MSRYKLYIFITIVLGILLVLAGYGVTQLIREQIDSNLIANYGNQEELIATNIATTFESEFSSTENQLTLMGQQPAILSGSTAACNTEMQNLLTLTHSPLGNVGRVDNTGVFHCSLNTKLIGTKADKLGPYIDQIFNDPNHAPVLSRAIQVPGATGYLVALHVPVYTPSHVFDGTIGGAVYLTNLYTKYLSNVTFAGRGYVILLDDDGTILYHQNPANIGTKIGQSASSSPATTQAFNYIIQQAKAGKSGTFEYLSASAGEKVAAYAPAEVVPGRTWIVVVTVPESDVRSALSGIEVDQLLTRIWLLMSLVITLCVIGFIFLTLRMVFQPLREINQMKSDFVSLVSHQLKTPVAQIKGYVENMLDGLTGAINDKQRDYLTDMLTVANKNSKLIDDLLNVSRIERGMLKLNPENLDLKDVMNDVLDPLRDVAKKKGVILAESLPDSGIMIVGDAVKTREAIRNIIDNAIKFSDAGMTVTVAGKGIPQFGEVSVKDEGPGIDPEVETELFKKDRIWTGKVKASGAGLGLYLSKKFIELGGGTITYVTAPSKGTTFFIRLRKP